MTAHIKMMICGGAFPYKKIRSLCDAVEKDGYEISFADNGNIILESKSSVVDGGEWQL